MRVRQRLRRGIPRIVVTLPQGPERGSIDWRGCVERTGGARVEQPVAEMRAASPAVVSALKSVSLLIEGVILFRHFGVHIKRSTCSSAAMSESGRSALESTGAVGFSMAAVVGFSRVPGLWPVRWWAMACLTRCTAGLSIERRSALTAAAGVLRCLRYRSGGLPCMDLEEEGSGATLIVHSPGDSSRGEMSEWLKEHAWKVVPERRSAAGSAGIARALSVVDRACLCGSARAEDGTRSDPAARRVRCSI